MNRFMFQLMYWLGRARWDSGVTPPEVVEAFAIGDFPPGPALDLGCGTGTNVIYMAKQGRQVVGIDFVTVAIGKARQKAKRAGVMDRVQFYVEDVTRIAELSLPRCAFALDMGCFHGLTAEGRRRYADELAGLMLPGGLYMLYALMPRHMPRQMPGYSIGVTPEQVQEIFAPYFDIQRVERGEFLGSGSTWIWMKRRT
jgi:SAM-dependent methyltransferase